MSKFDAKTRFLAQSARGNPERGLALLDKIDQYFERTLTPKKNLKSPKK
jgi:hypothetical protein